MLNRIRTLITGKDADTADRTEEDHRLAAAALLVEAARADEEYGADEEARVTQILAHRFNLSDEEVAELKALAEERQEASVNLHGFTRLVKDNWSDEERIGLIELLWEIAYADGKIHSYEDHLIRRVAGLIYISDRDRGDARKRVATRLGLDW